MCSTQYMADVKAAKNGLQHNKALPCLRWLQTDNLQYDHMKDNKFAYINRRSVVLVYSFFETFS